MFPVQMVLLKRKPGLFSRAADNLVGTELGTPHKQVVKLKAVFTLPYPSYWISALPGTKDQQNMIPGLIITTHSGYPILHHHGG